MVSEPKLVAVHCILPMPEPDFEKLAQQLEETLSKLKGTKDREERKALLREMRRLLVEADRIPAERES